MVKLFWEVFNSSLEKKSVCSYVMYFWPVLMYQRNWQRAEMRQGAKLKQEATSGFTECTEWWGQDNPVSDPGRRPVEEMAGWGGTYKLEKAK